MGSRSAIKEGGGVKAVLLNKKELYFRLPLSWVGGGWGIKGLMALPLNKKLLCVFPKSLLQSACSLKCRKAHCSELCYIKKFTFFTPPRRRAVPAFSFSLGAQDP